MREIIHLRSALPADAPGIAKMSRDLVEAGLGWSWQTPRVAAMISHPNARVMVAKQGICTLGFAMMELHEHHAHLNLLAVKPDYRRRGIADALLDWMESTAAAAGADHMILEVRASNEGAIGFYEQREYTLADICAGYYSGREHALRMIRPLSPRSRYGFSPFRWQPELS